MADQPNWPVVGGIYESRDHCLSREVKAIKDGTVFYCYGGPAHPEMTGNLLVENFQAISLPADESPIPDLIAAVRFLLKTNEEDVFCNEGCCKHCSECAATASPDEILPHDPECPFGVARAALAKAGAL